MQGSKKEQPQRGMPRLQVAGRERSSLSCATITVQGSRKGVQPASKPDRSAKLLQKGVISDALRDRHRGCRTAESPGCCPLRGSARAFPGRRPRAGIARRRSALACHRGARATDRWSFPPAPHGSDPAAAASANNRRHAPAVAVRSGPAALWAPAGPARSLSLAPQSAGMKERLTGSSAWEEKRPDRAGVPLKSAARFTICGRPSPANRGSIRNGDVFPAGYNPVPALRGHVPNGHAMPAGTGIALAWIQFRSGDAVVADSAKRGSSISDDAKPAE